MKRRGMHSFRSFFKPCITPGTPSLSNRPNEGRSRAYPYVKERTEGPHFTQNHHLNNFYRDINSSVPTAKEKAADVILETLDRCFDVEVDLSQSPFGVSIVSGAAIYGLNKIKETDCQFGEL
jgi:hypothetical protein